MHQGQHHMGMHLDATLLLLAFAEGAEQLFLSFSRHAGGCHGIGVLLRFFYFYAIGILREGLHGDAQFTADALAQEQEGVDIPQHGARNIVAVTHDGEEATKVAYVGIESAGHATQLGVHFV